jgi:hypothetical protein
MNKPDMKSITQSTPIALSLVGTIAVGAFWLGTVSMRVESNTHDIRELKDLMRESNQALLDQLGKN